MDSTFIISFPVGKVIAWSSCSLCCIWVFIFHSYRCSKCCIVCFLPLRCVMLNAKAVEDKLIQAVHSKNHSNLIRSISSEEFDSRRNRIASKLNSIYFNEGSSEAAYLATGSVVEVINILSTHIISVVISDKL